MVMTLVSIFGLMLLALLTLTVLVPAVKHPLVLLAHIIIVNTSTFDLTNVLWDGAGCPLGDPCCSDPNLPWFYRQLNQTTQDNIEVRSCQDEEFANEAILITNIELYIH